MHTYTHTYKLCGYSLDSCLTFSTATALEVRSNYSHAIAITSGLFNNSTV